MKINALVLLGVLLISSELTFAGSLPTACDIDRLASGSNRLGIQIPKKPLRLLFEGLTTYASAVKNDDVALLVDYDQPSTEKRAYLIDIKSCDVIANEYVIHGGADPGQLAPEHHSSQSGMLKTCIDTAKKKQNPAERRTNMTRPGFMITAGCHFSQKSWPTLGIRGLHPTTQKPTECKGIKLIGLEERNKDVMTKAVVLHEHTAVSNDDRVKPVGQGCPTFAPGKLKKMTKFEIYNNALVYIHAPQCKSS